LNHSADDVPLHHAYMDNLTVTTDSKGYLRVALLARWLPFFLTVLAMYFVSRVSKKQSAQAEYREKDPSTSRNRKLLKSS
jgi:hypothetical protein